MIRYRGGTRRGLLGWLGGTTFRARAATQYCPCDRVERSGEQLRERGDPVVFGGGCFVDVRT